MGTLRFVALALASAALVETGGSSVAFASPIFPAAVQKDLSLSYTPPCTICHTSAVGNISTAVQPFALAMRGAGLVLEDTSSLQTALMTLEAEKTDSDCDGTPEIQQLEDGRDPNAPGDYIDGSSKAAPADPGCMSEGEAVVPEFGCGAQLSRPPASWRGAAVLALLIGLSLFGRRCRDSRRSGRPDGRY